MENQLPLIGILVFDGVLINEVTAPIDVFTKTGANGQKLFNVILVGKAERICKSEEGIRFLPDKNIENCPDLHVLIVPGSSQPYKQIQDKELMQFIRKQNEKTAYTASHCAGAFFLGEAGIADYRQVVTYCGGQEQLKHDYPKLVVRDDAIHSVVCDGKIISSNGNLVSYLASLELLEKMSSKEQRNRVENELLINKLFEKVD